jgi:hypothetical protein
MSNLSRIFPSHARREPPDQTHEGRGANIFPSISKTENDEEQAEVDTITAVEASLRQVLTLLKPVLEGRSHDEAMATLVLSEAEFVEPLSKHEVQVLACGLHTAIEANRSFTYSDVLRLTKRFCKREMNITMIYETIKKLSNEDRQLIEFGGLMHHPDSERPSRSFYINDIGRAAFKMSIVNARLLKIKHSPEAA